ncbi:hypothetical protein [Mesorhizobium sp. J428]|uniref:hypothetical protein n=1 Tax=Mesorhizobium sp. J428 TaxID=2898440 RepID=UPI002151F4A9|nr:hypothetical protein [Mesorhizobium sp. J428]MCR5856635.1 hypothetical protein [Mesorhizobium sp. J428]
MPKPIASDTSETVEKILYLDQNAWVSMARGAWDKTSYPQDHVRLVKVVEALQQQRFIVPLSFANIYETLKINDPVRRANMARVQVTISGGRVFRGRRRILDETLAAYLADKFAIRRASPESHWFLSNLWFEAAADYSPGVFGIALSDAVLEYMRSDPARALFDYLTASDEDVRREGVRRFSAGSADLVAGIEARRAIVASETLALRKRAYAARLIVDELDFILATGRRLGLNWNDVRDIEPSLVRSIPADVPILATERELAVRLEDQIRPIAENDLRDMSAFATVLPLADIVIGEKTFVNLALQARLGKTYGTRLLTSLDEL